MTILYVNTGSGANAGNGDSLRSAFIKVNNNFTEILSIVNNGNGFTGSRGVGYTGSRGPGYTGYVGSQGYTGSQGVIGFTGSTGTQGEIGFTGSRGAYDAIGFTGSTGTQGEIGFTGSTGTQGIIGFTGSTGTQGIIGFTGSTGTQGIIGFTGSTGTRGIIGFTGSTGTQGVIGFTGSTGTQGPVGGQGIQGFTGSTGTQGEIGFTGSTGTQGIIGFTGSTGTQGIIGFTGSASTASGFTGSAGGGVNSGVSGRLAYYLNSGTTVNNLASVSWETSTNTLSVTGAINVSAQKNFVRFHWDTLTELNSEANPSTWHGMLAHVHATGRVYVAHSAAWIPLALQSDIVSSTGIVTVSNTATTATTGTQWFNTVEGRTYVATGGLWINSNPTDIPSPETYLEGLAIDGTTISTANIDSNAIVIDGGNNTKLTISNNNVTIQTCTTSTTSTWTFSSTGTLTVPGSIIPNANVVYDLGSPTAKFRSIYLSTSTIFLGSGTISISTTGQMLVNGNDAVSKLEYFGGEGNGPRDAGYIAWNTSTFTFNIPGKELLTAIYDLKAGSKIRAVNPNVSLDQEFTIVGNARQYTRGFSNEYLMAAIDVAETTSTNVYMYSLYLPVKDKTATLANGTWTLTVSTLGELLFPNGSTQTGASISIVDLKTLVAASTDFANFKSRIAGL